MTDAMTARGGEFRVGPVFGRAWTVYTRNFLAFTLVAVVIALPGLFQGDKQSLAGGIQTLVAVIVGIVFYFVGQAVMLYGAFQALRGRDFLVGEAVRRGLARFWSIIGVVLLPMLAFIAGLIVVSLLSVLAVPLGVIAGLAFFVLVVMFVIRWSAAVPACVVEGLGPVASLRRSAELTRGNRWKIFAVFVLIFVIIIIAGIVVFAITAPFALAGAGTGFVGVIIAGLIGLIVSAVYTAYFNIVQALIYHDLRVAKEGVDIDQLAAVFD
jgi:Membrane domain of glycerophosphoryl diester phosphodiesterase